MLTDLLFLCTAHHHRFSTSTWAYHQHCS